MAITTGMAILGGASILGGMYASDRASDAAASAAKDASSSTARAAAENQLRIEQNLQDVEFELNPWVKQERRARETFEEALTGDYVPGRDDIQPLGGQRSAYLDFAEMAPGQYEYAPQQAQAQTIPQGRAATGTGSYQPGQYAASEQPQPTSELGRKSRRNMLADNPEALARWNAIYEREDRGEFPASAYSGEVPETAYNRPSAAYKRSAGVNPGTAGAPIVGQVGGQGATGRSPYLELEQFVDTERIDPTQYMQDLSSGYSAFIDNPIYQQMIDAGVGAAESSAASQGMARSGPALLAARDVGQGVSANFFNNYLNQMGNITGINEARRTRELTMGEDRYRDVQNINEQRFANIINLDESRAVREQNVQEQRYSNYMNMLQGMAQPTTTTNLSNIRTGSAGNIANINTQSVASQNQYNMGAVAAQNAARADMMGGITNMASAFIGSQGYGGGGTQQTGGTIYGGGNMPAPRNYGGYA